ncbi:MAG: hypothetical protein ACRD21_15915 [Vicinamibacteria bacterium]
MMRFALSLLLLAAAPLEAESPKELFEKLKSLDGRWTGRVDDRDSGEPLALEYKVLSQGKAVIEIQAPQTSNEMMTVYYLAGDELRATHYCSAGNQPAMIGTSAPEESAARFSFSGGTGFDPARDGHVHDGQIRFVGADEIEHYWTWYQNGEKVSHTRWFLERAKHE